MIISTIVAVASNNVIGQNNEAPWYLPAELARFKDITMGHPIIMGRKTHESIGRALPGRANIVITHDKGYRSKDVTVAHSLEEAIIKARKSAGSDEIFIIGGEAIYKEAMPRLNRIYLTEVEAEVEGDKFFSYEPEKWLETSREKHLADGKNKYNYSFVVLEKT